MARRSSCANANALHDLGFSFEESKLTGFRVNHTYWDALCSIFDPAHNEFANITTDWVPCVFFICVTGYMCITCPGLPPDLREAFVLGAFFTAFQHLTSLTAHVLQCVNARISHAIWYLDYAGIILNFIWNGSGVVLILCPAFLPFWPAWRAANATLTVGLLSAAAVRVLAYYPPPRPVTRLHNACSAQPKLATRVALCTGLILLGAPTEIGTAFLAACSPDRHARAYALGSLLVLPVALMVKVLHLPERFYTKGRMDLGFLSFLHSHSVWHLLVFVVQFCYLMIYLTGIEQYECQPEHGDMAQVTAPSMAAADTMGTTAAALSVSFTSSLCATLPIGRPAAA